MGLVAKIKTRIGGGADNTRELVKNIILSFGVKGLSLVVVLASTPAYLAYFDNKEVLGLWFTLVSILTWILTCDMGVGNGLRNELVYALESDDPNEARIVVSSSYVFLCAVGCVVLFAVLFLSNIVDWFAVFNIGDSSISYLDLKIAITAILVSVILQFILRLISSILYALQIAYLPGLIALITNSILLFYCVGTVAIGVEHDIVSLAFVYIFAVNAPLLVTSLMVFFRLRPDLRPSFRFAKKDRAIRVVKLGLTFLWLQMMMLLLNNISSYLIALFVGNSQVVEYQIYYRIFTIALSVAVLFTTPVWSAATKAKTEGDYTWLWKLYKISMLLTLASAVVQFALCLPLQLVFDLWLGAQTIEVSPVAAMIFAAYGSLLVWSNVISTYANGLQELRLQTIFLTVGAVINVPAAIVLLNWSGSYLGMVVASIIAYLPYLVVQTVWMTKHLKSKLG